MPRNDPPAPRSEVPIGAWKADAISLEHGFEATDTPSSAASPTGDGASGRAGFRWSALPDLHAPRAFDHVAELAAHVFDAPVALVSLTDDHRPWYQSSFGIDPYEAGVETSIIAWLKQADGPTLVLDATRDPTLASEPFVVGEPGLRFYISLPLTGSNGECLGTLCVVDVTPHDAVTEAQVRQLRHLARLVVTELELRRNVALSDTAAPPTSPEPSRSTGSGVSASTSESQISESQTSESQPSASKARASQTSPTTSMTHFFAGVMHDLRSPLTNILLFADLLERRLGDASHPHLDRIRAAGVRMETMLSSLMELEELRSGRLVLEVQSINLADVARSVYQTSAPGEASRLRLNVPDAPVRAYADVDALVRILDNLIGNALKHSRAGDRVFVGVRRAGDGAKTGVQTLQLGDLGPVQVVSGHDGIGTLNAVARPDPGTVIVEVCDEGPGIPQDMLRDVFNPYTRGHTSNSDGVGLGLAIANDLVAAMGGAIHVQSGEDVGTCFRVLLDPAP